MLLAFWRALVVSVRLQLRHGLTLVYSFLFPALVLLVFWVVYRYESRPLERHMGEILAVAALSGACFGLSAALVSERDRGIWDRYRLTPYPLGLILAAAMVGRYGVLIVGGVLQMAVAMMAGTPGPPSVADLILSFTLVAWAFLGCGLLISMLANSVLAAQALSQTVFLPMLILGGIAVPVGNLPEWAQSLARCLPGTYAVDLLNGALGLPSSRLRFHNVAILVTIALTTSLAAFTVRRWHPAQRLTPSHVASALAVLAAGGLCMALLGRPLAPAAASAIVAAGDRSLPPETRDAIGPPDGRPDTAEPPPRQEIRSEPKPEPEPDVPTASEPPVMSFQAERPWRDVTRTDIALNLVFTGLPPDHGVVTPIADVYRPYERVECVRRALETWPPALVDDPVRRVGNTLLPAAVADVLQLETERDIPVVTFEHLRQTMTTDDLIRVLYWVAMYPEALDVSGLEQLSGACLDVAVLPDRDEVVDRITLYATKFVGRLTGAIK